MFSVLSMENVTVLMLYFLSVVSSGWLYRERLNLIKYH